MCLQIIKRGIQRRESGIRSADMRANVRWNISAPKLLSVFIPDFEIALYLIGQISACLASIKSIRDGKLNANTGEPPPLTHIIGRYGIEIIWI
ncbi:hypothetical protein BST28156_03842 [Burkholderia stagnalis]|nr:hypothetical protein BST28156_03842 [Burkholderia stagnalis]